MTDSKRIKIIETIAKMARLTEEGSNAFKGEISAASAKIQELMEKYAISQMDVQNFIADKQEEELKVEFQSVSTEHMSKSGIEAWEWSLASIIAEVTMTRYYSQGSPRWGGTRVVFFGVETNAKIATELYTLWHENIEKMARQATDDNYKELVKKYSHIKKQLRHWIAENYPDDDPRYFRASWIRGCLSSMRNNVYEEKKAREQERKGSGKDSKEYKSSSALVLYEEQVELAYKDMSKNFRHVNPGGSKGWSSSGYEKGKQTGSKIKIGSKQIKE